MLLERDKVLDKLREKIDALNTGGFNGVTIGWLEEWVEELCSSKEEQEKVLDVGVILDSLCNVDLYWYSRGNCESEDVRKCRGKDCNYCGRYND